MQIVGYGSCLASAAEQRQENQVRNALSMLLCRLAPVPPTTTGSHWFLRTHNGLFNFSYRAAGSGLGPHVFFTA